MTDPNKSERPFTPTSGLSQALAHIVQAGALLIKSIAVLHWRAGGQKARGVVAVILVEILAATVIYQAYRPPKVDAMLLSVTPLPMQVEAPPVATSFPPPVEPLPARTGVQAEMQQALVDMGVTDPAEVEAAFHIAQNENGKFIPGLAQYGGGPARGLWQFEPPAVKHLPNGAASFGNAYEETVGAVNYVRARPDYQGSFQRAWELWQLRGRERGTGRGWW